MCSQDLGVEDELTSFASLLLPTSPGWGLETIQPDPFVLGHSRALAFVWVTKG